MMRWLVEIKDNSGSHTVIVEANDAVEAATEAAKYDPVPLSAVLSVVRSDMV